MFFEKRPSFRRKNGYPERFRPAQKERPPSSRTKRPPIFYLSTLSADGQILRISQFTQSGLRAKHRSRP
jgi:hypothetical protein